MFRTEPSAEGNSSAALHSEAGMANITGSETRLFISTLMCPGAGIRVLLADLNPSSVIPFL